MAAVGLRTVAAFVLAVAARPVAAQDLEVFEFETFLDPRVLEIAAAERRHYYTFASSHLRVGHVGNYQFRDRFGGIDTWFYDWSSTIVLRRWQGTGRVVALDGLDGSRGERRVELDLGYYDLWHEDTPEGETVNGATRFQFELGLERREDGGTSGVLGVDVEWTSTNFPGIIAGLSYHRVEGARPNGEQHHWSLHARSFRYEWGGTSFNAGLGAAAEWREERFRCCSARLELQLSRRLGSQARVFLSYAPAYRAEGTTREDAGYNGEVALFVDFQLGAAVSGGD